jgi:16S rRNA C1402 N4-methylase RsmH
MFIGFHSLENYIIEKNIAKLKKHYKKRFNYIKRGLRPGEEEISQNSASRSGKLYAFSLSK